MIKLAKGRILIVDDDAALLGLLQTLLEEAGCSVETIHGAHGFTPQLMALARPALVLLNPVLQGLNQAILGSVVREFRKLSRAPVVLFADLTQEALARQAAELGADGYVPVRTLLRDPALQLLGKPQPAQAAPAPKARAEKPVTELEAEEILELELAPLEAPAQPRTQPPRPPAPPKPAGKPSAMAAHLVSAIEEEVAGIDVVEGVEHFDVSLDVMSDANLYTNGVGEVAGVFVPSAVPPDDGATVDLTVKFPWGGELVCEGKVEWSRSVSALGRRNKGGFGARFPQLSSEQQAMLQRFVRLRVPVQAPPKKG